MSPLYDLKRGLLVTGGGTGGHVIPAIELALAHRNLSSSSVTYAGTPGSLEERLSGRHQIPFAAVSAGGLVGKSLLGKISGGVAILRGTQGAMALIRRLSPGLVIGTGGYVQVPVIIAARILGVPCVLLEPNKIAGLANKVLAPFVSHVVNGWDTGGGIPLAPDVRKAPPDPVRFSRNPLRFLVMGGSQGARSINERIPGIVASALRRMPESRVEIIHQSGDRWLFDTEARYKNLGVPARVTGFLPGIASLFGEQSLVFARAGAMTVAEITASGTPAIYCPFPHSAGGPQKANALAVSEAGGGWCWDESRLSDTDSCARDLAAILCDRNHLFERGRKAWEKSPGIPASEWLLGLENLDVR